MFSSGYDIFRMDIDKRENVQRRATSHEIMPCDIDGRNGECLTKKR